MRVRGRALLLASAPAVARSEWAGTSDDRWDAAVRDLAARSGRVCVDERPDGQCLYRAVARQLGDGPPKRPLLAAEIRQCRECVAQALATHADAIARRSSAHRAALLLRAPEDDAAEDAAAALDAKAEQQPRPPAGKDADVPDKKQPARKPPAKKR